MVAAVGGGCLVGAAARGRGLVVAAAGGGGLVIAAARGGGLVVTVAGGGPWLGPLLEGGGGAGGGPSCWRLRRPTHKLETIIAVPGIIVVLSILHVWNGPHVHRRLRMPHGT